MGAAVEHINPAHASEAERMKDYQQMASGMQKWYWQQEFEADEVCLQAPPPALWLWIAIDSSQASSFVPYCVPHCLVPCSGARLLLL